MAIALAWAGAFGSWTGTGGARLAAALAVWAGFAWLRRFTWLRDSGNDGDASDRLTSTLRLLALAGLLALLARTLARTLVAVPAALWCVPVIGAAMLLGDASTTARRLGAGLLAALALVAALVGARFEAHGVQSRGAVVSGPIIGVHPRQAVAVEIDGFGPHDIVVDDYVEPVHIDQPHYDPQAWAEWLERELHAIAETHYADGPARARAAYAEAEVVVVDAVVPPAQREAYPSLLGVEVRSGTTGEGSTVAFVCPGQVRGPGRHGGHPTHACPRKYVVDGSTGLGLSSRFPGYTEIRGRDRARLGQWLGWPSGDAQRDRRSLALESGLLLALLLALGIGLAVTDLARTQTSAIMAALALLLAVVVALTHAGDGLDGRAIGPTWLALGLLALAEPPEPAEPTTARTWLDTLARLVPAGAIVLVSASPLAGRGDALALLDAIADTLVLDWGLAWAPSRALAGGLGVLAVSAGVWACADALVNRDVEGARGSEPRHAPRRWIGIAVVALVGVAVALRKPVDDLPLLHGVGALLIAASLRTRRRAIALAGAIAGSLLAALPVLGAIATGDPLGPVAWTVDLLAAAACLVLPFVQSFLPGPGPERGDPPTADALG